MSLLRVEVVSFKEGKKSHATAWRKGQCQGVTSVCDLGPYNGTETSRTPIGKGNMPTCKLCLQFVKQMGPVIVGL